MIEYFKHTFTITAKIFTIIMKSRKILLIVFLVLSSAVGLTMTQDYIFDEDQIVDVNEFSSQTKTITVEITDGVGSGDKG